MSVGAEAGGKKQSKPADNRRFIKGLLEPM